MLWPAYLGILTYGFCMAGGVFEVGSSPRAASIILVSFRSY